jgi:hypothetical protein
MAARIPIRKWQDFQLTKTDPAPGDRGMVLALSGRMRIVLANPNSTETLTEAGATLARQAASPGTLVESWTNHEGPPAVDSAYGDYRGISSATAGARPIPSGRAERGSRSRSS